MSGAEGADPSPPVRWWSLAIFVVAVIPVYWGIAYLVPPTTSSENSAAFYVAMLVAVALAMASHEDVFGRLGFRPTSLRFVLAGVAGTLALGFSLGLLVQESALLKDVTEMVREPHQAAASLVVIGVLSPLAEEVVFRGLLYAWFEGRWGPRVAMIGTSILFALAHQELAYIAVAFPLACISHREVDWQAARERYAEVEQACRRRLSEAGFGRAPLAAGWRCGGQS
ncbi:MAG: CPBP family intramembrane metalloprotease, partial [Reyranella sp.]|uniref:CPBP family intramembrane glutamic endopeptidase n=1 Tax=Reyranella sp. TaxID=1929291 RepID=UPI001ACF000E